MKSLKKARVLLNFHLGIISTLKTSTLLALLQKFGIKNQVGGFPGGAVVENLPANAGDAGSSPGLGRSHMPRSG